MQICFWTAVTRGGSGALLWPPPRGPTSQVPFFLTARIRGASSFWRLD